jgi:imidazolonepropionase-like amidohydrolase
MARQRLILAGMLALALGVATQAQEKAKPEGETVTVIRAGTLIDGVSDAPRHGVTIYIRGDRIEQVGEYNDQLIPKDARVIDLSHATVLPGLIDAHTHIYLQGENPATGGYDYDTQLLKLPLSFRAVRAALAARRALEQGFTTLRDVETEGAGYGDVGIKMAVNQGFIPGPRLYVVTRAISTTGGYPLEGYAPEIESSMPKGVQIVDGPVEARKAAREQLDNGADWIKVYMTHRSWARDGKLVSQPTLTVEELKAIVDETHGWGKKVACHAYNGIGLQRALDGGCDSIEHGLELTDANIAQMKRQGTWYCPTLSVYYYDTSASGAPEAERDRLRVELHKVSFQKAVQAGLKIAYGTDDGGFPWSEPEAQEFGRMVELGMTPMQAIRTATVNAAEMLDMKGKLGVIAPGAFADIIAVAGDPLKDIRVLEHVDFVMKDGKVFRPAAEIRALGAAANVGLDR